MSAPDPSDPLAARLFQAAREEPLPEQALNNALRAARAEVSAPRAPDTRLSRPARWALLAAAAAFAAGVTVVARPPRSADRLSAEPSSSRLQPRATQAPSASVEASTAVPSALPSAKPAPSFSVPAPPVHLAPASLTDELGTLKLASNALNAGDARAALAALDQYDHVLKGTKMRAEATLLRIEALTRAGQAGAASALAKRFVSQNPESPLVDRARSFVKN